MVDEATLAFWKYEDGEHGDDRLVYEQACLGGCAMEGLETLPVEELVDRLGGLFSGWVAHCDGLGFQNIRGGSFRVTYTQKAFLFECLGMDEDDLNAIIDLFYEHLIGLYDPVFGDRWDPRTFG